MMAVTASAKRRTDGWTCRRVMMTQSLPPRRARTRCRTSPGLTPISVAVFSSCLFGCHVRWHIKKADGMHAHLLPAMDEPLLDGRYTRPFFDFLLYAADLDDVVVGQNSVSIGGRSRKRRQYCRSQSGGSEHVPSHPPRSRARSSVPIDQHQYLLASNSHIVQCVSPPFLSTSTKADRKRNRVVD